MSGPEEVWFHKDKTGYWQWSFDPPLKRHELKFTHLVRADALDDLRAQRDALAEALRNTMRAAEGFMAAVRADTKTAYPWEPWEYESEKARAALAKVKP